MSLDIQSFGGDYRRMLFLSSIVSHLPLSIAYQIAGTAGRLQGPLRWQKETCHNAMATSKLSIIDWDSLWQQWVNDHGAFCVNVFQHATWDQAWFNQHVEIDTACLEKILSPGKGCLFLTYHHAFHHTLCSLLGLAGFRVNALAAPEETSVIYDYIGAYVRRLHQGSTKHFNGGSYRFFSTSRQAVEMTKESLNSNSILISLNDFTSPGKTANDEVCHLLGRSILAPSGSVRLAQRLGTPIVAGIAVREGTNYKIIFRQLDDGLAHQKVMQSYFDFLAELLVERPYFWDGWNWFNDLPKEK